MICKKCGAQLKPNAKFCGKCGARVEDMVEESLPKITPEPVPEAKPEYMPEPTCDNPFDDVLETQAEEGFVVDEYPEFAQEEPEEEPNMPVDLEPAASTESQQGIICPKCGAVMPAGVKFCATCGQRLSIPEQQSWAEPEPQDQEEPEQQWVEPEQPYQVPPLQKKKSRIGLWIGIGAAALVLIAIIVVVAILFAKGFFSFSPRAEGDPQTSTAVVMDSSIDSETSEETSQEIEESEESKDEISVMPKPTMAELACGAQISFDAVSVDLSGYAVDSLEGIETCTGIKTIQINGGTLTDLKPLLYLTNLETLVINNVPVTDIVVLQSLPNLKYLDIKDTQVTADQAALFAAIKPEVTLVGYTNSTYQLVEKDCTWEEAKRYCEEAGGHLVTIANEQEMQKILPVLDKTKLVYIWLGGYSENQQWYWVTGEEWGGYQNWYPGEPSYRDADGTLENKLCLWNVKEGGWTMNDQRNELSSFSFTHGIMGYICETEHISGIAE